MNQEIGWEQQRAGMILWQKKNAVGGSQCHEANHWFYSPARKVSLVRGGNPVVDCAAFWPSSALGWRRGRWLRRT
jgi:hypothetical protein